MRLFSVLFLIGLTGCALDADGDGFTTTADCDDNDASIYPGAIEACDGIDQNCDGAPDLGAPGATLWFVDADGDGFGTLNAPIMACSAPSNTTDTPGDCDDTDAAVSPNKTELCDGRDTDCNGLIDDGATDSTTYWVDADADGYGDLTRPLNACTQPLGTATRSDDCDDSRDHSYPGAPEWCDGTDNNCDGTVDNNALDAPQWFTDVDGDGFGTGVGTISCALANGALLDGDCDDTRADVTPNQIELCNGRDDDCEGTIDEGAADGWWAYLDRDGDGYGDLALDQWVCATPADSVTNADDCDDQNANNHPLADERCDGNDNNCDGVVDGPLSIDPRWWFTDADGDGWGDSSTGSLSCNGGPNTAMVGWDCDDNDDAQSPSALEDCADGIDNNCNGSIDECGAGGDLTGVFELNADVTLVGPTTIYAGVNGDVVGDLDGDGFDDMVIASQNWDSPGLNQNGAVWVIYGGPGLGDGALEDHGKFVGGATDDWLGYAVSGIGDIDGDGFDDLALTSKLGGATTNGAVYIVYGSATRVTGANDIVLTADAIIDNLTTQSDFGRAIENAGDLDNDGYDDFLIGHAGYTTGDGEGKVFLVYGGPVRMSGTLDASALPRFIGQPDDSLGIGPSLASCDLDGDGFTDLVLGAARSTTQRAYIVYGDGNRMTPGDYGVLGLPNIAVPTWDFGGEGFGQNNFCVGDLNNDGYNDLAMSAPGWDVAAINAGSVWVQFGGPVRWTGQVDGELNAGFMVAGITGGAVGRATARQSDINGDGISDLVVAAPDWDGGRWNYAGAIFVYYGSSSLSGATTTVDASLAITGNVPNLWLANTLNTGDIDGDGLSDLWFTSTAAQNYSGTGWVVYGSSLTP